MTLSSFRDMNHGRRITEFSFSAWACLLHASFPTPTLPPPAPEVMLVTGHDEIKEARGKTCFTCFSPGWRETGTKPQNRGMPRAPGWDWNDDMKTRGSQSYSHHGDTKGQVSAWWLSFKYLLYDSSCALFGHTCLAHTPPCFQRLRGRVVVGVRSGIHGEKLSLLRAEPVDSLCSIFSSAQLRYRILSLCWEYPAMLFSLICLFVLMQPLHTANEMIYWSCSQYLKPIVYRAEDLILGRFFPFTS